MTHHQQPLTLRDDWMAPVAEALTPAQYWAQVEASGRPVSWRPQHHHQEVAR